MRLLLFFDLPVEKKEQRKAYRKFVKDIKLVGFYQFQKSVYVKLCVNQQSADATLKKIKKITPNEGAIAILTTTEKQFADIAILLGENTTDVINNDERLIEL